jgi:voltage-gated potassium channel
MLQSLRNHLADIFDLHPKKSSISKNFDKIIYGIIVVSTIAVILETQPSAHDYLPLLEKLESVIISCFLLELVLQLSVIKTLFERHSSTNERLTILFYLAIDIVAVIPPVILFFNLHHHFDYFLSLRLIRIFKVFRHDHSVEFIVRAVMKKKTELLKSVALTMIFTVFLSVVLYEVESNLSGGNPTRFTNIMTSLWWSLDVYMDEVSGYVQDDFRPISAVGMFIAGLMGFMKIAIVVIPTGIIASGFIEVIEEDKVNEKYDLLVKAYRKKHNKTLGAFVYEQPHSLITIKNALNFSDQDIYKILEARDGFRMRSIMSSATEKYSDINIIEYFGYGTLTGYGVKSVKKASDLTLICPNNFEEKGMGYFSYCLSEILNTGLITNEKYRVHSLNPDFDFDFLNSTDYTSLVPNTLKREKMKTLSKPQKAFYSFMCAVSEECAQKKTIMLMKSDLKEKSFVISDLKNEMESANNLEKWLHSIYPDALVLKMNPHVLNEDRDYKLIIDAKDAIEARIGRKFTEQLVDIVQSSAPKTH